MARELKKKTKKEEASAPAVYAERESFQGLINDDDFEDVTPAPSDDNPFKELENLITAKGIDVKTVLTDRQVMVMHKLSTLQRLYEDEGHREGAALIKHYADRFMVLIINKNGLSRSQFIEGIGRGRERAEEARRERLQDAFMGRQI